MPTIKQSSGLLNTGKLSLMLLIIGLHLHLSGCTSKQVVCQIPEIPEWAKEPVPLVIDLQTPLFKALQE